jgi:biotin transport system substrate-specific component
MGVAWLSTIIGFDKAIEFGLVPFVVGDLVKTVLATSILTALHRVRRQS